MNEKPVEYCPKCKKWYEVDEDWDKTNLCPDCNSELEEPFLLLPPYSEEDIENLKSIHGGMFGICHFCGTAGHVDQLIGIGNDNSVDACQECIDKRENNGENIGNNPIS